MVSKIKIWLSYR